MCVGVLVCWCVGGCRRRTVITRGSYWLLLTRSVAVRSARECSMFSGGMVAYLVRFQLGVLSGNPCIL
jgi:hypothetical protein